MAARSRARRGFLKRKVTSETLAVEMKRVVFEIKDQGVSGI
jgi:hypothetical protein